MGSMNMIRAQWHTAMEGLQDAKAMAEGFEDWTRSDQSTRNSYFDRAVVSARKWTDKLQVLRTKL